LLAGNLMMIQKANERLVATALGQYQVELVKGIDFPPVYYDLEEDFGQETEIEPPGVGWGEDYTPEGYRDKFKVERYVVGYDSYGRIVDAGLSEQDYYDRAVYLKVYIYILRRKNNYRILETLVLVSKNGLY